MTERAPETETRENGVRCPKCHCRHLPQVFTRHRGNITIRVRECRNCGKRVRTIEKAIDDQGRDQL